MIQKFKEGPILFYGKDVSVSGACKHHIDGLSLSELRGELQQIRSGKHEFFSLPVDESIPLMLRDEPTDLDQIIKRKMHAEVVSYYEFRIREWSELND